MRYDFRLITFRSILTDEEKNQRHRLSSRYPLTRFFGDPRNYEETAVDFVYTSAKIENTTYERMLKNIGMRSVLASRLRAIVQSCNSPRAFGVTCAMIPTFLRSSLSRQAHFLPGWKNPERKLSNVLNTALQFAALAPLTLLLKRSSTGSVKRT